MFEKIMNAIKKKIISDYLITLVNQLEETIFENQDLEENQEIKEKAEINLDFIKDKQEYLKNN